MCWHVPVPSVPPTCWWVPVPSVPPGERPVLSLQRLEAETCGGHDLFLILTLPVVVNPAALRRLLILDGVINNRPGPALCCPAPLPLAEED